MIAQVCSVRFLLISLGFFCFVVLSLLKVEAQEKKESFYAQAIRGVVALYYEGTRVGTGFFVHTPNALFIVTAAHVVSPNRDLHALAPLKQEGGQQVDVWKLRLPRSEWVFHPIKGTEKTHAVDVAAMKIPSHKSWGAVAFMYCPENCPQEQYNQLANDDIEPPDQVVIFGFPLDFGIKLKEPRPFGRSGMVALKTKALRQV